MKGVFIIREYIIKHNNNIKVKAKVIEGKGVEFSNGITIEDFHRRECCEKVYADWSSLNDTTFEHLEYDEIKLDFVPDVGFRVNGHLVNCYNSQNGAYSAGLELIINYPTGKEERLDIIKYLQDNISYDYGVWDYSRYL